MGVLDKQEFKVGQRVIVTIPLNTTEGPRAVVAATIGGITFDHVITMYAAVLDKPLTRAEYPELDEKFEGWFSFSVPSGWMGPF